MVMIKFAMMLTNLQEDRANQVCRKGSDLPKRQAAFLTTDGLPS